MRQDEDANWRHQVNLTESRNSDTIQTTMTTYRYRTTARTRHLRRRKLVIRRLKPEQKKTIEAARAKGGAEGLIGELHGIHALSPQLFAGLNHIR